MRHGRIFTNEEIEIVTAVYNETQRVTAIQERMGWTAKIAQRAIKQAGIQKRVPRNRDDIPLDILKQVGPLYLSGLTAKKIGEMINLHEKVVVRIIKDENINIRLRPDNVPEPTRNTCANRYKLDDLTPVQLDVVLERMYEYSELDTKTGCIHWTGATSGKGYGSASFRGGSVPAHRLMYNLFYVGTERLPGGPLDVNLMVRHQCPNASCINPFHLNHGTGKDNWGDTIRDGNAIVALGEVHPNSKIKDKDVFDIILAYRRDKIEPKVLSETYDLSLSSIYSILKWESWKHLQDSFNAAHPEYEDVDRPTPAGENHSAVFTSDADVYKIHECKAAGMKVEEIAEKFSCSVAAVYCYLAGRTRKVIKDKYEQYLSQRDLNE